MIDCTNLRCPECGDRVFVSTISPDGWVMCRDMGHWSGPADDARRVKPAETEDGAIPDKLTYAVALKIIRGVCREIGCSGMSQSCESRPHDCTIIKMLCGKKEAEAK